MKTTLSFNDEELDQARMAFNGSEAHWALEAIDSHCRNLIKHTELTENECKILDIIREMTRLDLN